MNPFILNTYTFPFGEGEVRDSVERQGYCFYTSISKAIIHTGSKLPYIKYTNITIKGLHMCVDTVERIKLESVIAYKIMELYTIENASKKERTCVESIFARCLYLLDKEYDAVEVKSGCSPSAHYSKGFHAYKNLDDAKLELLSAGNFRLVIVRVKLSDVFLQGVQSATVKTSEHPQEKEPRFFDTFVANKCTFLEIIKDAPIEEPYVYLHNKCQTYLH